MAVTALSSEGQVAWDVDSATLATVDTWEAFEAPSWVRIVTIKNVHATGTVRVGSSGTDDATAAPGAVKNVPILAGESMTIALSDGRAVATQRQVVLHSTTASQTVAFLLEAAS